MKIAVSGKGGVGKTTLAALLCVSFHKAGYRVMAVDVDPDANLASTLGFPDPEKIIPVVELKEIIAERTGTQKGNVGAFFKLNPRVDDIPEKYSVTHNGIRLLLMGKVKHAGTGCYCPENAFVKELVGHLLLDDKTVVIMDMEAGIEHLGRGTSRDVDAFIIVVEPGKRSLETARRVAEMAAELGVNEYFIVANKVRNEEDRIFIERNFPGKSIVGVIPFSEDISKSGRGDSGAVIEDVSIIDGIRDRLIKGALDG
ncbi:MAG: ATP-binding protein [Candidatus Latescibacterota bacterium]